MTHAPSRDGGGWGWVAGLDCQPPVHAPKLLLKLNKAGIPWWVSNNQGARGSKAGALRLPPLPPHHPHSPGSRACALWSQEQDLIRKPVLSSPKSAELIGSGAVMMHLLYPERQVLCPSTPPAAAWAASAGSELSARPRGGFQRRGRKYGRREVAPQVWRYNRHTDADVGTARDRQLDTKHPSKGTLRSQLPLTEFTQSSDQPCDQLREAGTFIPILQRRNQGDLLRHMAMKMGGGGSRWVQVCLSQSPHGPPACCSRPPQASLSLPGQQGGSPKPHLSRDPFSAALVVGMETLGLIFPEP